MRKRRLCNLFLLLFILSGCIETRIIDEIAVIRTVAFDTDGEQNLSMTVSFPIFLEQGQENVQERDIITADAETVKGARILLTEKSQKPLEFGQLNVVLIGEELATRGVEEAIDSLYRDASVGNRITLALVKGRAQDIVEANLGGGEQTGVYLSDLVQQNMETNTIPATNMHEFLFSLYNDARDPFLPVLAIENDRVGITGTALFKDDKYIRTLTLDDSFILKLMTTPTKRVSRQFYVQTGDQQAVVVLEKIFSNRKRSIDKTGPFPKYMIEIDIQAEIIDYTGEMNLDEDDLIADIEAQIEEKISTRGKTLLEQFRDEGVDPVAVGEKYRSTTRDWKPEQWETEIYQTMEFDVKTNVEILSSGAIE
ncbi:Ger(x)C family spore germination protein [Alkalihalophilus marmarensis]|uniref:Ger(x)C family spore germination protein n=1 Tax=Alkalihalophilus marmarensis TaxID=521377 RepID=UPI002DC03FCF|nr:Ger(x)C family spore germination protein [Alkalihalophilus marmarensis]MEC2070764.1 Ger(x)C family spore germination protein [Alkalihalophilus marmarensis]